MQGSLNRLIGKAVVSLSYGGPVVDSISRMDNYNVIMGSGEVHVAGTLDGKLTVGSFSSVVIDGDILYERDPRNVPASQLSWG